MRTAQNLAIVILMLSVHLAVVYLVDIAWAFPFVTWDQLLHPLIGLLQTVQVMYLAVVGSGLKVSVYSELQIYW